MDNIIITVTLPTNEKDKGRKITFTAPSDATVDIWSAYNLIGDVRKLTEVNINLKDYNIQMEDSNG